VTSASSAARCRAFAEGVRAAMREDPDITLVGEAAAMRTRSAWRDRGRDGSSRFRDAAHDRRRQDDRPRDRRAADRGAEQTKSFLAQSLIAVITQILRQDRRRRGRKAICEVMVVTKAIAKSS